MKARSWLACFAVAVAMPIAASAEQAFTAGPVEVFAGPSSEYPPIAQLPPNTVVTVAGCLSDWSWCDVIFANDRGWIYAGDLVVPYQGARVVIIDYGPRIHFFPVITFSLVTYWDHYYRSRSFYAQRQEWVNRVHIVANHGGRAPAGHEHTARQSAPAQQGQQGQVQTARPAEKSARTAEAERARTTERTQSAQTEKSRAATNEKANEKAREAEKSRTAQAEKPRTGQAERAAPQPKEAQRPQVAQAPRPEQAQPKQERRVPEAQSPRTAQLSERQHQAQPHQAQQPPKAGSQPQQESHPQEANRREAGNAPREEKKEGKGE